MPASYSLFELNEYVRRVIALNFAEPVWINCEISQVKHSRGSVYLELVELDTKTQEIKAQISATIWYKSYLFLKNKLGALLPSLLTEGTQVMLKVTVEFHERYGLKLTIEDIDPSYTIGQMEMARQKILQRLEESGVIFYNKEKRLPSTIQKVAVISAENAAGFIDFKNHLQGNPYGYDIRYTLFSAALQGQNTEREICAALDIIQSQKELFDCISIIRGGGSKLDLGGFDNYNIGYKIATSELPVITGIGHDIDSTVADVVANLSLKTPTAVADFIIDYNLSFENKIIEISYGITHTARQEIKKHQMSLTQISQLLTMLPKEMIKNAISELGNIQNQIIRAKDVLIGRQKERLAFADQQILSLDPVQVLRRGFAIVKSGQEYIQSSNTASQKENLQITFFDGSLEVKTINK